MSAAELSAYARKGRTEIEGWFDRVDAEIFRLILGVQEAEARPGAVAEIGVHHGKSFVMLCQALAPGEKAICVDLFSQQELNLDRSGRGDLDRLKANLARYRIPDEQAIIRQQSSLDLKAEDVLEAVGPVRFFSVDGGHWREVVENDMRVAERALAEHGVIAADDFHRPEWPDVSAGIFSWYAQRSRPLVPFAIGSNKLYLAQEPFAATYQAALQSDPFLAALHVKDVEFVGCTLPVYSHIPLSGGRLSSKLADVVRAVSPSLYVRLKRLRRG